MPDKLTDSEIVKALECCNDCNCGGCPCLTDDGCKDIDYAEILDLINRLKAENESLKDILYDAEGVNLVNYWHQQCKIAENGCKNFAEENKKLQAKNEKLKELFEQSQANYWNISNIIHKYRNKAIIAKDEAYKEVFEKLNDKAIVTKMKLYGNWFIVKGVTLHDINTLKKEMVGEDNGITK